MLKNAEDFSIYATPNQMRDGEWGIVDYAYLENSPDPLDVGKKVIRLLEFPEGRMRWVDPTPAATAGIGFRMWLSRVPSTTGGRVVLLMDANANIHLQVGISASGQIILFRSSTEIARSAPDVISANTFQHFEMKATIGGVDGSAEIRVNGVTVINFTGNTQGGTGGTAALFEVRTHAATDVTIKDLVIWDGTGTRNSTFMGSVKVAATPLDADIAFNWTPSSGTTGVNLINNIPMNDASFISAAFPVPAKSEFSLSDLPNDITAVRAIVLKARAKKADSGDGNLQMGIKRGASESLGADRPTTTSFSFYRDVFETDPVTGGTITLANFNAMSVTVNRTA